MILEIIIYILSVFCFIYMFISYVKISNDCYYYKRDNIFLRRNIEDCYKYIDFLEKEKKEGHYD